MVRSKGKAEADAQLEDAVQEERSMNVVVDVRESRVENSTMTLERGSSRTQPGSRTDAEAPWAAALRAAESALAERDLRAAVQHWDAAHLAAVGSLSWEGLIEVGDAYLRIGRASGLRETTVATTRRAYFAGLFRACQKDSLEGILRTARAFAGLGDAQVVEECLGLAELLVGRDPVAQACVAEFVRTLEGRPASESGVAGSGPGTGGVTSTSISTF